MRQVAEEIFVLNGITAKIVRVRRVGAGNPNVRIRLLDFLRARVRLAVGRNDAVHAEVLVGRNVDRAEVAAVTVVNFVGLLDFRLVEVDEKFETVAVFAVVVVRRDFFRRERAAVNAGRLEERAGEAVRVIRVAVQLDRERRFGDFFRTGGSGDFLTVNVENQRFAVVNAGYVVPLLEPTVDFAGRGDPAVAVVNVKLDAAVLLFQRVLVVRFADVSSFGVGIRINGRFEREGRFADEVQFVDVRGAARRVGVFTGREAGETADDGVTLQALFALGRGGFDAFENRSDFFRRRDEADDPDRELVRAQVGDLLLRNAHRDPLVDPVPNETALQVFQFANSVPIKLEVAVAVPHRVRVFALNERAFAVGFLFLFLGVVDHAGDRHIHRAENIGVPVELSAFVLNRARRVELFQPFVRRFEVRAVPGFVPERPNDDRRVVAVAERHSLRAVHMRGEPFRRVRERFFAVAHPVRFDVRFVDDVQTVFVAEFVPARVVRIVASANRVDVQRFHQPNIFEHTLFGDRMAGRRVVFVAVDAFDENRLVVDEKLTVADFDLAETDVKGRVERRFEIGVVNLQVRRVEPRGFRRPKIRSVDRNFERDRFDFAPFQLELGVRAGVRGRAADIFLHVDVRRVVRGERQDGGSGLFVRRVVLERNFDFQNRFGQVVVFELRNDFRVDDRDRRLDVIVNGAENPAEAEEVLVFEVRPVGAAINLHRDGVATGANRFRNIELDRRAGVFPHPDFFAVDVNVEAGLDAAEMEDNLLVAGDVRLVDFKLAAVEADPVFRVRNVRRRPRFRPRVGDVRVDRVTVPFHLEVRRNRDRFPLDHIRAEVFHREVKRN